MVRGTGHADRHIEIQGMTMKGLESWRCQHCEAVLQALSVPWVQADMYGVPVARLYRSRTVVPPLLMAHHNS